MPEARAWNATPSLVAVLVAAAIGLVAATVLSHEALVLAGNSSAQLGCSLNAAINCASVANHWSSQMVPGVPNSFWGMISLPVVMNIAVVLLTGARLPRWFMCLTQLGVLGGLVFAGWMLYMSLAVIRVLCPWCLVTDVIMLVIFFGVTRYNLMRSDAVLPLPTSVRKRWQGLIRQQYDWVILCLLVVGMAIAIMGIYGQALFT